MTNLIEQLVQGIRESDSESFLGAGEVARAYVLGTGDNIGLIEPYNTELKNLSLTVEDIEALRHELISYIKSNVPGKLSMAIKALATFRNPEDTVLFTTLLEKQLEECMQYNATLGQLVAALDENGEEILQNSSFNFMDPTSYITDALHFIYNKKGKAIPW